MLFFLFLGLCSKAHSNEQDSYILKKLDLLGFWVGRMCFEWFGYAVLCSGLCTDIFGLNSLKSVKLNLSNLGVQRTS